LLLLAAGLVAMQPAAAEGGPTGSVVVSRRDVAVGSVLWPSDVRVVQMPDSLRPAGILSSAQSVDGRVLAGAARTGEPITDARLAGASPGIPAASGPGTAVVPIRLAGRGSPRCSVPACASMW
jgi:Flp pilus assembly protein CpaB